MAFMAPRLSESLYLTGVVRRVLCHTRNCRSVASHTLTHAGKSLQRGQKSNNYNVSQWYEGVIHEITTKCLRKSALSLVRLLQIYFLFRHVAGVN